MRFLVDSCVSRAVCDNLRAAGHDVQWVPDLFDGDPGDGAIIDAALTDDRVLITGDKDFGEWVFLRGKKQPPLVRLAAMNPSNQVQVVRQVLNLHATDLEDGALITATSKRIRIRSQHDVP